MRTETDSERAPRVAAPPSLAVALGVAHATPPALRLPPLAQQIVPGRSPLEATGWAVVDADDQRSMSAGR